jgi:hypothetical protein
MTRLPKLGGDVGEWGKVLNDYLLKSHTEDGFLRPIDFASQFDRTGQILLRAVNHPNGYVAKNIIFADEGTLSRGGPVWVDVHGRVQTWIGWHDELPSGSAHHGFEVKTASDPAGPAPDVLATRFRLKSDSDRTQAAFYSLENLYLDHGAYEPDVKFGIVFDEPQAGDVVSGNAVGRYRVGKIMASVDAAGAATMDITPGLDNATAAKLHIFRDSDVPEAHFAIYAADNTTTQVFYIDAKTGHIFLTGRIQQRTTSGIPLSQTQSTLDGSSHTIVENDVFTTLADRNATIRFFRNTNTTATRKIRILKGDGTDTDSVVIDAGAGTISAVGADGASLQKAVLADDPRVVGSLANLQSSNVPTMDRLIATSNLNVTSGSVYAVRAVVRKTGMYSKIRFCTASTPPAGITDLYAGVFNSTTLAITAQTANIASLTTAANAVVEASLAAPIGLTLGTEVFLGLGFVGSTLQLKGATVPGAMANLAPVLSKTGTLLTGSSLSSIGGSATGNLLWVELVP